MLKNWLNLMGSCNISYESASRVLHVGNIYLAKTSTVLIEWIFSENLKILSSNKNAHKVCYPYTLAKKLDKYNNFNVNKYSFE